MSESVDFLQRYRDTMDPYIEELGVTLGELGHTKDGLDDYMLVEAASRKLKALHSMLLASGMSKEMLKAVMAE